MVLISSISIFLVVISSMGAELTPVILYAFILCSFSLCRALGGGLEAEGVGSEMIWGDGVVAKLWCCCCRVSGDISLECCSSISLKRVSSLC